MATALFDFRDPLPMPPGAARLVANVDAAAPRVGLVLGTACGRPVDVTCAGVRRAALVEVAEQGAVWAPLRCGLPDPGLLLLSARGAVALADLLMGGTGAGEDRAPRPLELELVAQHLVPALRPLADALADHGVTGLHATGLTDAPLPAGLGEVLAVPLEVDLPGGGTARATVCLPAKSLLPSEPDHAAAEPSDPAAAALAAVPVRVAVRLAGHRVAAGDVEGLQPGDVLALPEGAAEAVVAVLPGPAGTALPLLTGGLGRRGPRRAVVVHALDSLRAHPTATAPWEGR